MRIAVIGAANQGKSTFINDMIKEWPMYKRSNESYRRVAKERGLSLNKNVTRESQTIILDCLINDIKQTRKGDNVFFDRCPLDNVVFSLWAHEKGYPDIDKEFVKECMDKCKEALRSLDIIFFVPITAAAPVKLEPREGRELDETFIKEIDNLFKAVEYQQQRGDSPLFVKDDAPPIIEVFGSPRERIEMAKLYLNVHGDCVDTVSSVISPENLSMMEGLLREQGYALEDESKLKAEKNMIIAAKLKDKLDGLDPLGTFDPKKLRKNLRK